MFHPLEQSFSLSPRPTTSLLSLTPPSLSQEIRDRNPSFLICPVPLLLLFPYILISSNLAHAKASYQTPASSLHSCQPVLCVATSLAFPYDSHLLKTFAVTSIRNGMFESIREQVFIFRILEHKITFAALFLGLYIPYLECCLKQNFFK